MFTLMAVFLLQFLMKFADRLVGKGLGTWVISKLIVYNLAWMVVLVGPMAVLVATLMAFGSMAQNNEVAILKASGVSLYKMMIPPLLGSILLMYGLIQFNNNIYPDANHAARILMHDISRKKPTLSLVPGVFSQEVVNYAILVRAIAETTNELDQVTIYDRSDPGYLNVVTANHGKIYFSKDQRKLVMDLQNGEIHQTEMGNNETYQKLIFDEHRIVMDADQFSFQQTALGGQRGDRELGAGEMLVRVDSLGLIREKYINEFDQKIEENFISDSSKVVSVRKLKESKLKYALFTVDDQIKVTRNSIKSNLQRIEHNKKEINRYWVEIHKKYSLPVACIVFILIGAPLGTMVRKGGFGVAAGISLVFFLIYWAFLIGGEKLADRGLFSPFWGMWSANIFLGILGIYLTIKSAKERVTLSFDFLKRLLPEKFRQRFEHNENS